MPNEQSFTFDSPTSTELEQARTLVGQKRLAEAESLYRHILDCEPLQVEALRFLANAALARSDPGEAVALLSRAAAVDRSDLGVMLELGVAYRIAGRRDESRHVFQHALELSQGKSTIARLMLAHVFEGDNRPELALLHYFRAILDAQAERRWLSDESTEPGMRRMVRHAMEFVAQGRRAMFNQVLGTCHANASGDMRRIEAALSGYLRERVIQPDDARQRWSFLYLPGLGTSCTLDSSRIPKLDAFAARISDFDDEIESCLADDPREASASPFSLAALDPTHSRQPRRVTLCDRGHPTPSARHLPCLLSALKVLPLMQVPGFGANVSLLQINPGIRSNPEFGASNAIATAIVKCRGDGPANVGVGGESHVLKAGHAVVVDGSFGTSFESIDGSVCMLLMDVWHPSLLEIERDAFTAVTQAALAFDARVQDLDRAA